MKIEFIGPAALAKDGGIDFPATLNDKPLLCHFSYEVLEEIGSDGVQGDACELFEAHKLKLLSIAEQKILDGRAHASQIHIYSNDLPSD